MIEPEFDAWTRRRFGLAAGGVFATVLGLLGGEDAEARKKHRKRRKKKRCKKLGSTCTQGAKRKCCGDLRCSTAGHDSIDLTFCCKTAGKSCSRDEDCCAVAECDNGVCTQLVSDRALKANFASVDPTDMLQRVRDLPISTWNYTSDDPAVRHIGPMAQDFAATFGVGTDDRHIHPIDGQGIALAAIQGLMAEIEQLRAENAELANRIDALERSLD